MISKFTLICALVILLLGVHSSDVQFVAGAARDEIRECILRTCSTLPVSEDADFPEQYNITCGRSGEVVTKTQVSFGIVESGECNVDGTGFLDDEDGNKVEEFTLRSNCGENGGSTSIDEETRKKIESACNDKATCGSIDGVPFAEFMLSLNEELNENCGGEEAEVILAAKCGPPGFDVLAVLPLLMTAFIGLALGCSLTLENFERIWISHKLPFFIGLASQFLFMPLISFIYVVALNFPQATGIGMIVMGSCPGGATSNLFTYWVKGDVALSITMSGASTLCAIFMMPFLLWLYIDNYYEESGASIPFTDIIVTLIIAVVPAVLGVFIRNKNENVAGKLETSGSIIGLVFLLAVLVVGISDNPDLLEINRYPLTWTVCLFYQPLGTLFGYGSATASTILGEKWKILRSDKRAIAMECGVQSYGLGVALVSLSFKGCERNATLMPLFIATLCYIINSFWIIPAFRFYSRFDPQEETEAIEKEEKENDARRSLRASMKISPAAEP